MSDVCTVKQFYIKKTVPRNKIAKIIFSNLQHNQLYDQKIISHLHTQDKCEQLLIDIFRITFNSKILSFLKVGPTSQNTKFLLLDKI